MTEDRRKLLTLYLRECWHEWVHITPEGRDEYYDYNICKKCKEMWSGLNYKNNRTFTTWQDMGDLKKKIVEMGEWDEFIDFTLEEHGSLGPVFSNEAKFYKADYIDWLMNPERFCELVAKWWKERRKG